MGNIANAAEAVVHDPGTYLLSALVIVLSTLLLGGLSRLILGKQSAVSHSLSSAIGILFVYALTVSIHAAGARFQALIAPLPFVEIQGDHLTVFSFEGAGYPQICTQLLSLIIMAFTANLIDSIMPRGETPYAWFLLRCATVLSGILLHLLVSWLLTTYLPEGLVTYAPAVLLTLLVVLLLVGCLKWIVGLFLSTIDPVIGALYTFFFASFVGKALSKAMLTTAVLAALILALNKIGFIYISIAPAALMGYIPLLIVLVPIWYLVG